MVRNGFRPSTVRPVGGFTCPLNMPRILAIFFDTWLKDFFENLTGTKATSSPQIPSLSFVLYTALCHAMPFCFSLALVRAFNPIRIKISFSSFILKPLMSSAPNLDTQPGLDVASSFRPQPDFCKAVTGPPAGGLHFAQKATATPPRRARARVPAFRAAFKTSPEILPGS